MGCSISQNHNLSNPQSETVNRVSSSSHLSIAKHSESIKSTHPTKNPKSQPKNSQASTKNHLSKTTSKTASFSKEEHKRTKKPTTPLFSDTQHSCNSRDSKEKMFIDFSSIQTDDNFKKEVTEN